MQRLPVQSSQCAHISPSGALALALVLASSAAFAAEPSPQGWTITLKANGGVSPAWEGSGALSPYLLPGLSVRRAGSPLSFSAPDDSAGFAIFDENWLKAGVVGKLKGPRRSAQHADARRARYRLDSGGRPVRRILALEKLRARIEARHGFVGHHGNTVDFSMDWVERRGPWTVSVGPRFSLGDSSYMDKLFGVSASRRYEPSPAIAPRGGPNPSASRARFPTNGRGNGPRPSTPATTAWSARRARARSFRRSDRATSSHWARSSPIPSTGAGSSPPPAASPRCARAATRRSGSRR
ncbi:MAG: MipA/OmpV family protein [Methylobacteriaceae bacterium]|nr:MipA/OmpV family protein [Methylobacteriaceae bacterium]